MKRIQEPIFIQAQLNGNYPKQAKKQVIINLVVNRRTNSKFLFVITLEEILKRIN